MFRLKMFFTGAAAGALVVGGFFGCFSVTDMMIDVGSICLECAFLLPRNARIV